MKAILYSTLAAAFLKGMLPGPGAPTSSGRITADSSLTNAVVRRIHKNVLTIDTHLDLPVDFGKPGSTGQFDLAKLEAGDLDVATVAQ